MTSYDRLFLGDRGAEVCVVRLMGHEDVEGAKTEYAVLREAYGKPLAYIGAIFDGDDPFSPWPSPAVFKNSEDFTGGAGETLDIILNRIIPDGKNALELPADVKLVIGGYSLSALFALWAGCVTDSFRAVAAPSPSAWYPGWDAFISDNPMRAGLVYLSLGDREHKTRNPVMATVADRMALLHETLKSRLGEANVCFEWTSGNHFADVPDRVRTALQWTLNRM